MRIAKSDIFILAAAVLALLFSLSRWAALEPVVTASQPAGRAAPSAAPAPRDPPSATVDEPAARRDEPGATAGANAGARAGEDAVSPEREAATSSSVPATADSVDPATAEPGVDTASDGVYVVVSGDTLSALAERFGTSTASLQELNALDDTLIFVGQELRYRRDAGETTQ